MNYKESLISILFCMLPVFGSAADSEIEKVGSSTLPLSAGIDRLNLNNNKISDISAVENKLELISLNLDSNNVYDISPLRFLSYTFKIKISLLDNPINCDETSLLSGRYPIEYNTCDTL